MGVHIERDGVSDPARLAFPAGRHHEPGGGRTASAAARPVRADRGRARPSRRRRRVPRWSAAGSPSRPTRRVSPPLLRRGRRPGAPDRRRPRRLRRRRAARRRAAPDRGAVRAFDVDGMRADLVSPGPRSRTPPGTERDAVTEEDIRTAARLALPHRRRRDPSTPPALTSRLDEALSQAGELIAGDLTPPAAALDSLLSMRTGVSHLRCPRRSRESLPLAGYSGLLP